MIGAKSYTPTIAAVRGVEWHCQLSSGDSALGSFSRQALHSMNGEQRARDYLSRLHAERVEADELAATVAMLSDAVSLAGFCRVIEKALGVRS